MLQVQQYLLSGKTFDNLTDEFGIIVCRHDTDPLVILNYDQIRSPKTHPIVRECRGLVLHTSSFRVVARGFNRFYNIGEVQDEMKDFDFSDFYCTSKEDGSLILLYHFEDKWRMNTRGSFGQFLMDHQDFTWEQGFCKALGIKDFQELDDCLDRGLCYVCELCSPWNKVVRIYKDPKVYLLTCFYGEDECPVDFIDGLISTDYLFHKPKRFDFKSIDQIKIFLDRQTKDDPTFEGVVVCDKNRNRWKIKSSTYLGLHRLKGEGNNLFNPKHLLPFVLSGESSELLTYFPEAEEAFFNLKTKVDLAYATLQKIWEDNWRIESQKEFALSVIGKKTPFSSILFNLRKKYDKDQTIEHLQQMWRENSDLILKILVK